MNYCVVVSAVFVCCVFLGGEGCVLLLVYVIVSFMCGLCVKLYVLFVCCDFVFVCVVIARLCVICRVLLYGLCAVFV